ncbi:site-specific integrase [Agromyces sp. NBRC 114283]|uniref:site-specific integrase n=1 Tax=Agromyces sp. NBRC 114283 TaxID=2994521 RepID=UPI0024A45EC5|nr:site-specific integrase [Agromyces sp. NBRC 114283]GLU88887.1 putative phage integrase [Agromyces sp. NBRC 114283]
MLEIDQRMRKQLPLGVAAWVNKEGYFIGRIELPTTAAGARRRREFRSKDWGKFLGKAKSLYSQFRDSGDLATSSPTVRDWMTAWLDDIAAKRVRPKTLAGYRSVVNKQIIEAIGNVRLEKLTPAHVRRVHDHITGNGGSSTYALNAHRILSKALEDAIREGKLYRNPATMLDAPRKARRRLEAFTVDEAVAIVKRCAPAFENEPYDPEPARWATYLLTGARRGEILGLEWDRVGDELDLSWQLQRIRDVANAPADFEYREIGNGLYWTRPKSLAGWRMIPLVDPLAYILNEHRKRSSPNPWGLVFANKGKPIDPDTETKRWPTAREAMGVEKGVRLHDLRHTTVDLLYEAGVAEDIIMEIVGHSVRTVTRGYKSRGNQVRRVEAMRQLSQYFSGVAPSPLHE